MLYVYLATAAGGAIGSMLRLAAGQAVATYRPGWPAATLLVNVVGSGLIGLWAAVLLRREELVGSPWDAAIRTGILGGLTTFSSFSLETLQLLQRSQYTTAALVALANVALSVLAAAGGYWLAK